MHLILNMRSQLFHYKCSTTLNHYEDWQNIHTFVNFWFNLDDVEEV